jgi:hypothetical protein
LLGETRFIDSNTVGRKRRHNRGVAATEFNHARSVTRAAFREALRATQPLRRTSLNVRRRRQPRSPAASPRRLHAAQ